MKRRLAMGALALSSAALWVGAVPCRADTPEAAAPEAQQTATTGTPRIEFPVSSVDFGHKVAGEDLKTSFTFRNTGDGVLRIEQVKGG